MNSSIRVESHFAMAAHQRQVNHWLVTEHDTHSGSVQFFLVVDAATGLAPVVVLLNELLTDRQTLSLDYDWSFFLLSRLFNGNWLAWLSTEQEAGSENFKAVAPALAVDDLCNPIQSLCVPVGDGVVKDSQHFNSPVAGGGKQWGKALLSLLHGRGNGLTPCIKPGAGLSLGLGVVDGVKRFLEVVGRFDVRLVVQPHAKTEAPLFVQVLVTHPQQCLTPHPVLADFLLLVFGQRDANVVHSLVCHLDQVELVNDYRKSGKHSLSGILVGSPHVDCQALDGTLVPELIQPGRDRPLIPVWQHVNGNAVFDIGDDAPQLAVNLGFINSEPLWQVGLECRIESSDVCVSNHPDGFVIASNVLGNTHEGVAQALGLDVLHAPGCHSRAGLDAAQGLQERVATVPALVALDVGQDVDWCATNWAVTVGCSLGSMAVQAVDNTALLAGFGLNGVVCLDDVLSAFLPGVYGLPAWEI